MNNWKITYINDFNKLVEITMPINIHSIGNIYLPDVITIGTENAIIKIEKVPEIINQ